MNILIVRLSAIGDIVMASPMASLLKQRYPDASITWLTQPETAALLQHHPHVDEVLVWRRKDWSALFRAGRWIALGRAVLAWRRELRSREYDLAIDLQGLLKSGIHCWLSGARRRVGLGSREGSERLMTEVIERGGDDALIGSEYRYLAQHLGLDAGAFRLQLGLDPAAESSVDLLLDGRNDYVVLCPFTTRPQKHWFMDRWIDLAHQLKGAGISAVVLGGPGDVEAARAMDALPGVSNLTGKTSLTQAASLIQRASALVGVDTGLTHMGVAADIPVVALFGSTRPYLRSENTRMAVIYRDLPCAPCRRRPTCHGRFDCMRAIDTADVMQTLRPLLKLAR